MWDAAQGQGWDRDGTGMGQTIGQALSGPRITVYSRDLSLLAGFAGLACAAQRAVGTK